MDTARVLVPEHDHVIVLSYAVISHGVDEGADLGSSVKLSWFTQGMS